MSEKTSPNAGPTDFIRAMITRDVAAGKFGGRVVTRFPPEPNGFLHIGHAKSICLNFGVAQEYTGARCHLRFDDTNPETEDIKYVDAAIRDVRWLGFDWGEHLYFASDYFPEFYRQAEGLVRKGLAYVDSSSEDEIREARGTVMTPGVPTKYRTRTVDENLDLLGRMRAGEFPDGAHVVRAKIDLSSPNMLMRDPILLRIRHAAHYRQGDAWCLYPLYDYAHPLEDAIEGVTHSLCTLEFENNREIYDWVVDNCDLEYRPEQTEFARLALDYTVVSKRKLLQLVDGGHVNGWDDPRMPTLAGLRRRGVTPEAIRRFADMVGVAKTNSRVDIAKFEFAVREDLNQRAPRVLCVTRPLRVVITNYPEGRRESFDAPYWPHDVPKQGSRPLPFSREILIERDDFMEDPPRSFHRLAPGREVRLRYAYIIRCDEVVKDAAGEVVELRCTYDPETRGGATPDGRTVKGTIHWVSASDSLPCEVRLYDRLFRAADPEAGEEDFKAHLNPESLVVLRDARIEPSVAGHPPGSRYQFERLGYFCADSEDSGTSGLVFNRTVTLRDTWAKIARAGAAESPGRPRRKPDRGAEPAAPRNVERPPRPADLERRYHDLLDRFDLGPDEADRLTRDAAIADFFEEAAAAAGPGEGAKATANWMVNELSADLGERGIEELPFRGADLGRLARLVLDGTLSSSGGRDVLHEMVEHGGDPGAVADRLGLRQVSDADALAPIVDAVLAANPAKADEYRSGRTGLLGFFVGQVMGRTKGAANPGVVRALLEARLGGGAEAEALAGRGARAGETGGAGRNHRGRRVPRESGLHRGVRARVRRRAGHHRSRPDDEPGRAASAARGDGRLVRRRRLPPAHAHPPRPRRRKRCAGPRAPAHPRARPRARREAHGRPDPAAG